VTQGITVTTPDTDNLPDPGPALEHADRLLRHADPLTEGMWSRMAARLMRCALERAVDRHWHQARPEVIACPIIKMRILMLETALGRASARDAYTLWSSLSDATHPHPYELAPTGGELRRWHDEVAQLVRQLAAVSGPAAGRAE